MSDRISKTKAQNAQRIRPQPSARSVPAPSVISRVALAWRSSSSSSNFTNHIIALGCRRNARYSCIPGNLTRCAFRTESATSRYCLAAAPSLFSIESSSIGSGNTIVVFFSTPISVRRLQVAQLQRNRLRSQQRRGIHQLLRRVELAFRSE